MEEVVGATGSEGLGDKGVEADKKALPEEGKDKEEGGADADGGDGLGAVGEPADHHGVHDGHADPADLGQDEGQSQVKGGAKLGAKGGPGEHERIGQFTGQEVTRQRKKGGGVTGVKKVEEVDGVKVWKLLVGRDRREVPLTGLEATDRLEYRDGVCLFA